MATYKAKKSKSTKTAQPDRLQSLEDRVTALESKPVLLHNLSTTTVSWDVNADKGHIVALVVANELQIEHRWPPNDVTKVMGTDYRYDQFTMANFLAAVQRTLAQGTPAYHFIFNGAFVLKALQAQVGTLMMAINQATT